MKKIKDFFLNVKTNIQKLWKKAISPYTKYKEEKEKVFLQKCAEVNSKEIVLVIKEGNINEEKLEKIQKISKIIVTIITYAFLVVMSFVVVIPFYWMLITSLKTVLEAREEMTFFPQTVMWSNYIVLFKGAAKGTYTIGQGQYNSYAISAFPFWTYLKNTLIVGIISTALTVITSIMAAFAFARLTFKGKDLVFTLFLATMMIPGEMMVITNYITVAQFGWLDSNIGIYASMIIPFIISVFYIYLLRQNFKQIPNELYYAAKVDGKTDWAYLWKVMVPLAAPTLITIFILKLMGAWNSYIWPNLVTNTEEMRLITNGLRAYSGSADGMVNQPLQMAATVLVTLPLLLLFIFFRKYIMRGVGRAGIKG